MVNLNEENKQLFGEQVNDHISKLNDLMAHGSGMDLDGMKIQKTCFANRLLEGSTRMLGLDEWSRTLSLFGELLTGSMNIGRCWDEHLSQVVSEILETEEQVVAEIITGEIEEIEKAETFSGLEHEIKFLITEVESQGLSQTINPPAGITIEGGEGKEDAGAGGESIHAVEGFPSETVESGPYADMNKETCDRNSGEGFMTLERLMKSLQRVNERLGSCIDDPDAGEQGLIDLELAFGESEFFVGLLGNMLKRIGDSARPFRSKVSSRTVLDGVRDFTEMHGRLREWRTKLEMQTSDFSLEGKAAADLAVILECCIYDICRMHEGRDDLDLQVDVDISSQGSYLVGKIGDNGENYICDSEIDGDDTVAYYQGLLKVRGILKEWKGILWVEPEKGSEGRFRFSFPRTSVMTDYHVISVDGAEFAIPSRCIARVVETSSIEIESDANGKFVMLSGTRVPVCRLDELAADEIDAGTEGDHIVIVGLAEERLGIYSNGPGRKVEGLREQLTRGNWASLTARYLHFGEQEYPILEPELLIRRYGWINGFGTSMEEAGTYVAGEDAGEKSEEEISRV